MDGFRHAILTEDDPYFIQLAAKRQRPYSSASYSKSTISRSSITSSLSHHNDLEDCLRNLNIVIRKHIVPNKSENKPNVIEKLNLSDVEDSDEEIVVKANPQPLCNLNNFRLDLDSENMRAVKSNRTARNDVKENTELSDRVLQWLDLAGKVNLLTDNAERMSQPRHSWPEIQRRNLTKSKTATELRAKEVKVDTKISGPIDRPEYYMPTSANTIENYARLSRNTKHAPHEAKVKENKKVKDMRASVIETRKKMVSERKAVEKQYAEIISKKLLPDVGKTKKQVHIFMPEATNKKCASSTPSLTESLLSQKCSLLGVNRAPK